MRPGTRAIDEDVRRTVEATCDRVRALPTSKKAILLRAAAVLEHREMLHGEEPRLLLAGEPARVTAWATGEGDER